MRVVDSFARLHEDVERAPENSTRHGRDAIRNGLTSFPSSLMPCYICITCGTQYPPSDT
jgi:hypothetical protein